MAGPFTLRTNSRTSLLHRFSLFFSHIQSGLGEGVPQTLAEATYLTSRHALEVIFFAF